MATAATVSVQDGEEESSTQVNVEETREREPGESEGWTVPRFNHPVYKKLSSLNGELNALSFSKLKEKLTSLNLSATYVAVWVGTVTSTLLQCASPSIFESTTHIIYGFVNCMGVFDNM